jgi:hypothetical protein
MDSNGFNPLNQSLDFEYLLNDGWTIPGNLAYRHILHDYFRQGQSISEERIQEIIFQYDCLGQTDKIKESLFEFIQVANELNSLLNNLN